MSDAAGGNPPLERVAAYRAALALADFTYDLEDRFPEDEVPLLFRPLCAAALAVGAEIAAGFGRDGLDARGGLSETTRRAAGARLSEMRHYMTVSVSRYCLDKGEMKAFDELERKVRECLGGPADGGARA